MRAPEQGTGPNVFYLGADEAALDPLAVGGGDAYLTTEVTASQREKLAPLTAEAEARAMTDVEHPTPWGWRVSSYFLTKGDRRGRDDDLPARSRSRRRSRESLALRGHRRNRRVPRLRISSSRGASTTCSPARSGARGWRAARSASTSPRWSRSRSRVAALAGADGLRDVLRWVMVPAGALLAAYTAFLFGQCEGRDLWQSRLLLPHTLVNAWRPAPARWRSPRCSAPTARATRALGRWAPDVRPASPLIALDTWRPARDPSGRARGAQPVARSLRAALLVAGAGRTASPARCSPLAGADATLLAAAGVPALVGLWLYEDAWVRAGQSVPLS